MTPDETRRLYRGFATREARGRSPLYERLALSVADDDELARLLDRVPPSKRQPNLLFACVRFLGGLETDYEAFRTFVLGRADEVLRLLADRRTQTNEVGRCAALLPVLARIDGPIALIEVGASAGLCLLLDRFQYRYGDRFVGKSDSPVALECRPVGPVPVPARLPQVTWRRGIDIAPLDVMNDEDVRWLEACVWPDGRERVARLRAAIDVARVDPPIVERGDAVARTADIASEAPSGATVIVFHSALIPYLDEGARQAFITLVGGLPISWVSNEDPRALGFLGGAWLQAAEQRGAFAVALGTSVLALSHPHGAWLEWIA